MFKSEKDVKIKCNHCGHIFLFLQKLVRLGMNVVKNVDLGILKGLKE